MFNPVKVMFISLPVCIFSCFMGQPQSKPQGYLIAECLRDSPMGAYIDSSCSSSTFSDNLELSLFFLAICVVFSIVTAVAACKLGHKK
jgi:hypothetical protein